MVAGVTASEPLVASLPLHEPLAVQAVALLLDQVRVAVEPAARVVGLTASDTVGGGVGASDTLKPNDCVAAASVELPAKLAVSGVVPADDGVSEQLAAPFELVVAVQFELPKVKVIV